MGGGGENLEGRRGIGIEKAETAQEKLLFRNARSARSVGVKMKKRTQILPLLKCTRPANEDKKRTT